MQNPLRLILKRTSYPLNKIYVSRNNLLRNYEYLSSINSKIKIAPVLKSNAYGHGIELVGKTLDSLNVHRTLKTPFICVDSIYEAYQLKRVHIKTPILIMGYIDPKSLQNGRLPFSYAIYDLKLAKVINEAQKGCEVHIFVDTGMHREGVSLEELPKFLRSLKELRSLKVVGLMSHLAIGAEPEHPLTIKQLKDFEEAIRICEKAGLNLKWKHLGGSNAILHLNPQTVNVVRVGLGVYGIDPAAHNSKLKPVLTMTTKIVQIRVISKGESTGYNARFVAKKKMTIGILPIGYNDGVDRRLSNKGAVSIGGIICPIIGMLSMNMTTIDLSKVKNPKVGDEVVVFSNNPKDINSIENSAKACDTTPYVLLVNLATSTRREIA